MHNRTVCTAEQRTQEVARLSGKEPDVWVVVCMNDKPHPSWGIDEGGPLVLERYTRGATREAAMDHAAKMERAGNGACRIARLVFD